MTNERRVPPFTTRDACRLADAYFGLVVEAEDLPSYIDRNFALNDSEGRRFVLKFANAGEPLESLDFQHMAMDHLAARGIPCPQALPDRNGNRLIAVEDEQGHLWQMHLLSWMDGVFLGHMAQHSEKLLHSFGRFMGQIDRAFAGFSHPAMERYMLWNPLNSLDARVHVQHVKDSHHKAMAEAVFDRLEHHVLPRFSELRHGVIHCDANDYNVLGNNNGITGIIDFGDMSYGPLVSELSIGAAYMMLKKADPLSAAVRVTAGYHEAFMLTGEDLEVLFDLIKVRLAMSGVMAAREVFLAPENEEYLTISSHDAWEALEKLEPIHPNMALYAFRDACNLPPVPHSGPITAWLRNNPGHNLLEDNFKGGPLHVFDFSAGGDHMEEYDGLTMEQVSRVMFAKMEESGARTGWGRYDEERDIYSTEQFVPKDGSEPRTLHMGVDLFARAGTAVMAPYDGVVHSTADNDLLLDYGPTVVLEHKADDEFFYTLYGHLGPETLEHVKPGDTINAGQVIAWIGAPPRNGNWVPHLHFQVMTDMLGKQGDFQGVAPKSGRNLWRSLCPDPNLILGVPPHLLSGGKDQLLEERRTHLGTALSLSYKKHLKIVAGEGQYLIDENGRKYLDMVNNVCHVGHCHPHVVAAAREQNQTLNTNTRYLHDNIINYAKRLAAKLPDPLSVVYLVCTGSEANDLALRMARAHTGKRGVVTLDGAYHGHLTSLIDVSPYKHNGPGGAGRPDHVRMAVMPDPYRGPIKEDDLHAGAHYAGSVRDCVAELADSEHGLSAFICESLLGCGGQVVLPDHYLREAFLHVRRAGGLCITDEVQVGFGRVGSHFWGFQLQDVVPDIVTMGKPIGNGHPMAAVITTPEIAASFDNGMEYFNTFGGNPVSCAVGLAVLDVIEEEGLQEHARRVGDYLMDGLRALSDKYPLIGEVRGSGLFIGAELVRDRATLEPAAEEASRVIEMMKERGVLLSTDGPLHNVIKIKPPLVFDRENAAFVLKQLDEVFGSL